MTRIAVYKHLGQVWYDSLAEVVTDLTTGHNTYVRNGETENRLRYYLGNIVLFNVRYRDIFRAGGAETLYPALFKEAPALQKEKSALKSLEDALDRRGRLGDYDIQCISVNDSFCVHGRVFDGLNDVRKNVELYMRRRREPSESKHYQHRLGDVHVLCYYEPFPIFDSSDWGEDRTYCNFFFKNWRFGVSDFRRIDEIPDDGNLNKANERLPFVNEMPLLYYPGDGDSMLLVTAK